MSDLKLEVLVLESAEGLALPSYESRGAAGLDLRAAIDDPIKILPGQRESVPTGLVVKIPPGHEGQVRARSGLAARDGVTVLNGPGTIDEDYRGELRVLLINHGRVPFVLKRGDRIAQLVIAPVTRVTVVAVDSLDETARGAGGFGSTGR